MTKDATKEALLATLKRHSPHRVRAYNGDDDTRDIAVPQRRRRWAQVIEAIEARPWTRVELQDKSGSVLAYVDNEGPARDVEDIGPSFAGVGGQLLLGERIAALCMKSVQQAIVSRDAEMSALLQAQGAVVREMASAVKSLGEVYREQTVAAEEAAENRAAAAAAEAAANGGDLKQLMEALPMIMRALPMLQGLLAGGGGDTPPNGHSKRA